MFHMELPILYLLVVVLLALVPWAHSAASGHDNESCLIEGRERFFSATGKDGINYLKDSLSKLTVETASVALCDAVEERDLIKLELLLDTWPKISAKILKQKVFKVLRYGDDVNTVQVIFDKRSDIMYFYTSIGFVEACTCGHFEIISKLFDLSTSVESKIKILPHHVTQGILEASKNYHFKIALYLLEKCPETSPHFWTELFQHFQTSEFSEYFKSFLSDSDTSSVSELLVITSSFVHPNVFKMILDARDDIDDSFITKSLLKTAQIGHIEIVVVLLNSSKYQINASSVGQALIVASRFGHSNVVKLLIDAKADEICNEFAGEGLLEAVKNNRLVVFEYLLTKLNSKIDASFKRKALLEASKSNYFEIYKRLLESMDVIDVNLARQDRINIVRQVNDLNNVSINRVGLSNNFKCCRIISLVTCLFNIPRFREVFYASEFKTELSVKLAELFAKMQLGIQNIDMEDSFVQYLRLFNPDYKKTFWGLILKLRDKIFNILPEETKNLFQLSLRISDRNDPEAKTVDLTKNFITISKKYRSVSEAFSSDFQSDVNNVFIEKVAILPGSQEEVDGEIIKDYNCIEIMNEPEILMIAIVSSLEENKKYMQLDDELEIFCGAEKKCKYILQAFCYTDRPFTHHMSFVRDFNLNSTEGDWYRYNDNSVSATITEKHKQSFKNYANTTATFAIYVRSDVLDK